MPSDHKASSSKRLQTKSKGEAVRVAGATIYLVRHGETVGNREGRWLGRSDSPLTLRGVEQALAYADVLAQAIPDRAVVQLQCSPLFRARQTASLISDRLGLESRQCKVAPLLVEHAFGQWEQLTEEEIEVRFPGAQKARHRDHWSYIVPGGESYTQVYQRSQEWLKLRKAAPIIIAVTHAKASRTLRGAYLGIEPASILAFKHPQDRIFFLHDGMVETIICAPTNVSRKL